MLKVTKTLKIAATAAVIAGTISLAGCSSGGNAGSEADVDKIFQENQKKEKALRPPGKMGAPPTGAAAQVTPAQVTPAL